MSGENNKERFSFDGSEKKWQFLQNRRYTDK